jgi:hypothetical protein
MARAGIGMDEQRTGRCASYRSPRYIWPREWHGNVDTDLVAAYDFSACTCYQEYCRRNTFGFDAKSHWDGIVVGVGRWITSKSDDVMCGCNDYERYDVWSPSFVAILSWELGFHPIPLKQCLIPVVDHQRFGTRRVRGLSSTR